MPLLRHTLLLLSLSAFALAQLSAVELAAMQSLKAAWLNPSGWSNADPCTWPGITCTGTPLQVTQIGFNSYLGANITGGTIPTQLGDLKALEYLSLPTDVAITGTIPTQIGVMTALKTLIIGRLNLTGPIPTQLPPQLVTMYLYELTGFTSSIPLTIGTITTLQTLKLVNISLTGTVPSGLWSLPVLRNLSLANNNLTGSMSMPNLPFLQSLELQNNQFSGALPSFTVVTALTYLDLHGNFFSGTVNGVQINALPLASCDLSDNRFTDCGLVEDCSCELWPPVTAYALGTGTNGPVYNSFVVSSTEIYVVGSFTSPAARIAKWNGNAWSAMGTGITDGVLYTVQYIASNKIYVGGSFGSGRMTNVAQWGGSSWSSMSSGLTGGSVNTFAYSSISGNLYAGGDFTNVGPRLAVWGGSNWRALGTGTNGPVYSLALNSAKSYLWIGGAFTQANGLTCNGLASYYFQDSKWAVYTVGDVRTVRAPGETPFVFFAGLFSTITTGVGNLLANNVGYFALYANQFGAYNYGLNGASLTQAYINNQLWVAGNFTADSVGNEVTRVAKWDSTQWVQVDSGANGAVYSMSPVGSSSILVTGSFSTAFRRTASNVVLYTHTVAAGQEETETPVQEASASPVLSGGYIALIVILCVLFVGIVVAAIVIFVRRSKRNASFTFRHQ